MNPERFESASLYKWAPADTRPTPLSQRDPWQYMDTWSKYVEREREIERGVRLFMAWNDCERSCSHFSKLRQLNFWRNFSFASRFPSFNAFEFKNSTILFLSLLCLEKKKFGTHLKACLFCHHNNGILISNFTISSNAVQFCVFVARWSERLCPLQRDIA